MHINEVRAYLQHLLSHKRLPFSEIIDLCVVESIQSTHRAFRLQALPNARASDNLLKSLLASWPSSYWVKTWPSTSLWGSNPIAGSQILASVAANHTQALSSRHFPAGALSRHLVVPIYQDDRMSIEPYVTAKPIDPRKVSAEQLAQAASVLAGVHQSPKPSSAQFRSIATHLLEGIQLSNNNPLNTLHLKRTTEWLRRLQSQRFSPLSQNCDQPLALCHFDVSVGNWLWCEQRRTWLLIDWEYAALANPWVDLATFVSSFQLSRKQSLYFLEEYFLEKYVFKQRLFRRHFLNKYFHKEYCFNQERQDVRDFQNATALKQSSSKRYNQQALWRQLHSWRQVVERMALLWASLVN